MRAFELKLPPVLVFLLCGGLAWGLARVAPPSWRLTAGLGDVGALLLMAIAVVVALAALAAFHGSDTTVDPRDPARASRLVDGGVYRFTRNPMYLALALLLAAWALRLGQPVALLAAVVFWAWITRFQVIPEERALEQRFGEDYRRYRQRVRRWL